MDVMDLIREGKISRYFRAKRKLNVPNLVFHITQRAGGKEPLFVEDDDYLYMLSTLKDISLKHNLNVYAFCFMQNHVHMLFSLETDNLYDAMRELFSKYARRFNEKYERKGHIFGGRYRQAVCLDDSYLLAASLYIHLNPVRAGLVNDALDYRWSTCRLYCQGSSKPSFVDPYFVLGILSTGKRQEARRKYRHLLQQGGREVSDEVLEQEDAIERFRSKLSGLFALAIENVRQKQRVTTLSGLDLLSVEDLEKQIEDLQKIRGLQNTASREARKYVAEQLVARGYTQEQIAKRVGVSRKTVHNLLRMPS